MTKKQTKKSTTKKVAKKTSEEDVIHDVEPVDGLYKSWFLDYASYVILERAVPRIEDGFKPVQRRIAHAIKEMDDGRFNKVANVIGQTMQYHPHGDTAIGEAMVNLGQKDLLLQTQGNWGDVRTGDSAAAPRYIEARLSKFALDVVYNPQTTEWQLSYDSRKKEPVTLPVKFPLLLAQGVEGIAVGLSTKILPHNFREIAKASIEVLQGKNPKIFPDFPTGGYADFTEYDQGLRGGRIKVRAKIEIQDKKTLVIKEIPFGTTTISLIESIVKASEKGKIKVKKVVDNTAKDVEVQIQLQSGQSPDITMDALYAFTDCEVSISPNACVIVEGKPRFMRVNKILEYNTQLTVKLLKRELEIKRDEFMERILFSSLEKIFIEKRIYRNIEECETFEDVINTIDKGLKPYKRQFYREITKEDILRLTEIKIKRISKYDSFKADELLRILETDLKKTKYHLNHLTEYAISYYRSLLDKYGKGKERKTEIKNFRSVTAIEVIANNQKLYVNRADGFVGYGLKRDEFISDCSDIDDIIVIRKDGRAIVSRISEKGFMGKDIFYVGVWKKGDDRMVFNLIYTDGKTGKSFVKRFSMPAIIRDREYDLTQGSPHSRIHYLSANPNGEAEVVQVKLTAASSARKKIFDFNFSALEVKGRGARGNTLTKYPIRKVELSQAGVSTLSGLELWFDPHSGRLNKDRRGRKIGKFDGDDLILAISRGGHYKLTNYDLNNRYEPEEKTLLIEKFNSEKVINAVYIDGESKVHYVKRFQVETTTLDKEFGFISEAIGSRLEFVTSVAEPELELEIKKDKGKEAKREVVNLAELIDVKGWKALGNRLSNKKIAGVRPLGDPDETQEPILKAPETKTAKVGAVRLKKKLETSRQENRKLLSKSKSREGPQKKAGQNQEEKCPKQASLFAEEPQKKPGQKEKVVVKSKRKRSTVKAFGVGDTIDLEL